MFEAAIPVPEELLEFENDGEFGQRNPGEGSSASFLIDSSNQ
jgi:hypothetical protein